MRKKYIQCIIILAFVILFSVCSRIFATDLDEILNYEVVVEPRMNDGTLDITYKIAWKVLDSTTEGPLEWVQIGTPNSNFDNVTALSNNIKSIKPYNGAYVKIIFDRKYYAGETITFKYKIHQSYMYKLSWGKCKYTFTPAWFTDVKIDRMKVKWNMDGVKTSNADAKEDNYLVWSRTNMAKGEKIKMDIKYDKSAFGNLNEYKQSKNFQGSVSPYGYVFFLIAIAVVLSIVMSIFGGGGYYRHSGFYGGYHRGFYGGCVMSSCACACARSSCACSCACACAGSGRAGCSRKDFYGTKINNSKLKKVLDSNI